MKDDLRRQYNDFERKEMEMIHREYGKRNLEVISYKYRKRLKEYIKNIKEIAEKNDVPYWKAEAYYRFRTSTDNFLYFREERNKSNFKNEIKKHFEGYSKKEETIIPLNWKELYEILGEEAVAARNKFAVSLVELSDILEVITNILSTIKDSVARKYPIPYRYEQIVIKNAGFREDDAHLSKLQERIKRYLFTELPKESEIDVRFYTEEREEYAGREYYQITQEASSLTYNEIYETKYDLYISIKYSYAKQT